MVLRETLTRTGIGLIIGLVGAYVLTRLIQAHIFGVKHTDLLTMAAASFGIAAVTAWQSTSRRGELRDRSDERVEVGVAREARYREGQG
jgi:divalent metal cation (Fe/Co/Zn/Cd) transporter